MSILLSILYYVPATVSQSVESALPDRLVPFGLNSATTQLNSAGNIALVFTYTETLWGRYICHTYLILYNVRLV